MSKRPSSWLAAAALFAVVGCNQSSTGQSSSATSTNTTSTTTTPTITPEPATTTTTTPAPTGSTGAAMSIGEATTAQEVSLPSGLKYQDIKVGDGAVAETGMTASVHYTGWLTDGTKFDSSVDRGQPFSFRLGAGQVIRGWDDGVKGMRVGGKRKLTIPPTLGYGEQGAGGVIPPNATLVFDVQLLDAK